MGGKASRRGKSSEMTELYGYETLPPGIEETELFENSLSSTSLSSNDELCHVHQYQHLADNEPLDPKDVLEHFVRDTIPNISQTNNENKTTNNRFLRVQKDNEESALSSGSDSGDRSTEKEYKIIDDDEIEIDQSNDYNQFCDFIRPQLEKLLNGYHLDKVPFTYQDYKQLLVDNGVDNFDGIKQKGLSIKYEPQIVILQSDNYIYSQNIPQYESSLTNNSIYYVDAKCLIDN